MKLEAKNVIMLRDVDLKARVHDDVMIVITTCEHP